MHELAHADGAGGTDVHAENSYKRFYELRRKYATAIIDLEFSRK